MASGITQIFDGLKEEKPVVDNTSINNIFDNEFAPSEYSNVNELNIGTTPGDVEGIGSQTEAMQFAASMGFADTYRGLKQWVGINEEEMRNDQQRLNRIFANKSYGKAALASYMGGVIADPFGWVIPVAKAKSVYDMAKLGVKYGAVFGAAGYTDEEMYDKDAEFWEQKLYQTGLGAAGGGVISGAIGLAARKAFRFGEQDPIVPVGPQGLTDVQVAELNRASKIRNNEDKVEQLKQGNFEEQMTLKDSYVKRVGRPFWDKISRDPLGYTAGAVGAGTAATFIEDGNSAGEYALNTGLTALAFLSGKKIGDAVSKTEVGNKILYAVNPEIHMNADVYNNWNKMKGTVQLHQSSLANLHKGLEGFNQDEKKLAYQLFSGDLDEDLLVTLSKNGKLTPEQAARQEDLGMADNISGATVDKILSLNADKIKAFRELGEDMRLSGLLDDDVFQTNLGTYLNRAYDYTKQNKGTEAASKFKKTLASIKGDGLMGRGTLQASNVSADTLAKIVPSLRAERKLDYKIKNDFEKRYSFNNSMKNLADDDIAKNGKLINRVEQEADPDFAKGVDNLDQSSNYGVVVKKSKNSEGKEIDGKYDVHVQLTRQQRQAMGEIEDASLAIVRTMKELNTTVGLGKLYQSTFDLGRAKGYVFTKDDLTKIAYRENGNIQQFSRVNAKGKTVLDYTDDSIMSLEQQLNDIRLSQQGINRVPESFTGREDIEVVKDGLFYGKYKERITPYGNKKISPQQVPEGGKRITRKQDYYDRYVSGQDTAAGAVDKIRKQINLEREALKKKTNEIKSDVNNSFRDGKQRGNQESGNDLLPVPKTKVKGTDNFEYGKLAGQLVTKDTLRDLELLNQLRSEKYQKGMAKKWFETLSFWKKTKTVLNPAVHMNNLVANFSMFYMANGSWKAFAAARKDFLNITRFETGKIKKEDLSEDLLDLYKYGGLSGDMVSAELRQQMKIPQYINSFDTTDAQKTGNFMSSALDTSKKQLSNAKNIYGKYIDRPMSDIYQLEDKIFRLGLYKSRLKQINPKTNQLYTKQEASNDALKYFVDYDIKSPIVNGLRNTMIPFLSYSYRVVPLILETAVVRPEKFAVLGALGYAINEIGRLGSDSTKIEEERERGLMQDFRNKEAFGLPFMVNSNIRLPYNGKDGGAKYFDFNRKLPGGDVFQMGGDMNTSVPFLASAVQPGGPGYDALNKFIFARDPFTGKQYNEMGMNPLEKFGNRAAEFGKGFIPNVPVGAATEAAFGFGANLNPASQKITQSLSDEYQTLSDPLSPVEAIANTFGLTINTADIPRLQTLRGKQLNSLQSQFSKGIKDLEKQRMKGLIDFEEYQEEFMDLRQRFTRELEELSE